jgi:Tetratricopeptide repeat/TIR domain
MNARYDVFVSHTWAEADLAAVRPLVQALREQDLRVFIDEAEVDRFARITTTITEGLAASKVLLAYYSATYPKSQACQWELTAAFLAAQRAGDPAERILVVNPEPGFQHLYPGELRDALAGQPPAPGDQAGLAELAGAVAARVRLVPGPLGAVAPLHPPRWLPAQGLGSTRFVGRLPELWRLHAELHPETTRLTVGRAGPAVALVRGLGGVGKTLLAEEYALRFAAAYPGGVFWLRAYGSHQDRPASFEELAAEHDRQVRTIAARLGLLVADRNPDEVRGAVAAALHERGERCLWVVDDLPDGLDAPQVQELLAPDPVACTLLTTRSRRYDRLAAAVDLDVLTPDEALALLTGHRPARTEQERADAVRLVADLGWHALAVEVAGAALRAQAGLGSFAEFRAALQDPSHDELELAADLAGALPGGHRAGIAATLRRSLRRLDPAGSDVLRLSAVLAAAPLPLTLLAAVLQQADGLAEQAARQQATRGVAQAENLSLASQAGLGADPGPPAASAVEGGWVVHALVARTMRLSDSHPRRTQALRATAVAVLSRALEAIVDPSAHTSLRQVVPHARELARDPDTPAEATLLGWVARYDHERGDFRPARLGFQQQWDAYQRLLGPEHPDTLQSMNNLAAALRSLGNLAGARALHQQVLDAYRQLLGSEHPNTLVALSNLATTLRDLGELAGAQALHQQVAEASRRRLGAEHPDTLRSMSNVAETLRDLGELAAARALHQQVADVSRRRLGPEHPDTLRAMNNLALTLDGLGDLAGARDLLRQVLDAYRHLLGPEHPSTLTSMSNLAGTLHALGDLAGARELQDQVLDASRRRLGREHPDTLRAMNNLAVTLSLLGDLDGARELLWQVVDASQRLLGAHHPNTRTAAENLAGLQRALNEAEEPDLAGSDGGG